MAKHKDKNTEESILEAANEVFQTKGLDGSRMQEIADKANINKAMLHYYYRSKQLLFDAVFKKAFSLLAPELNAILNDDTSVEEKVKNFTFNYINFISKHPYIPNFVINELNKNPTFIEKLQKNIAFPNIEKFRATVHKEIEEGKIAPINPDQLFVNIISLNVFPFIGAPLFKAITKKDNEAYNQLLIERKHSVSNFIINAIKNNR